MSNMFKVAIKELNDNLNSKLVYIMLIFYVFIFIATFFTNVKDGVSDNSAYILILLLIYSLCYYSTLVAMAMAYSSFFSEIDGKAINILLTKPLYRDTIINGKFINALIMSAGLFIFTIFLSIVMILVFFRDPFEIISVIFNLMPILFILSILCIMFFYSITMLICTAIKDQILSLFTSFLSWILIFYILNDDWFAGYLSYFFHNPNIAIIISELSPFTLVNKVLSQPDIITAVMQDGQMDIIKLILYTCVAMITTYAIFVRRDIN